MNKPNLFLVGVPKSGTTSMHVYLAQHPEIFMSSVKEPSYFAPDLQVSYRVGEMSEYLSLFKSDKNAKYFGESSADYMYSELAAKNIKKFCPDAKIIVMLRHPVDMLYSWHGQLLSHTLENILDFEEALAAVKERQQGKRIPVSCNEPKLLFYFDIIKYSEQLKRYYELFNQVNNIHVILFDDFCNDTARVYRETLKFLGVDTNFQANLNIYNSAPSTPNLGLRYFLFKRPWLKKVIRQWLPPIWINWADKSVNKLQPQRPKKIDPVLRARLTQLLEPEIKELGYLLGRDLTHWLS